MTEEELRKVFCKNIKKYRKIFDWSQSALAKKAGTSVNFISDIESGKKWASPVTMVKIANAFDIEVYELLRPPDLFPDNLNSIIKKYTDDVHAVLEQACLDFLQAEKVSRKKEVKGKHYT